MLGCHCITSSTPPTASFSTSTVPTTTSAPSGRLPRTVTDVLDDVGLVSYLPTTGSRGLHVVAPLRPDAGFDTVRQFARDVADLVAGDDPDNRTTAVRKAKRGDRVYMHVLRNAYERTAVAPFSVRVRDGAPVATPLEWDQLSSTGRRPDKFTIHDLPTRLAGRGDPWADIRKHGRSLSRPRQRLSKMPRDHG